MGSDGVSDPQGWKGTLSCNPNVHTYYSGSIGSAVGIQTGSSQPYQNTVVGVVDNPALSGMIIYKDSTKYLHMYLN